MFTCTTVEISNVYTCIVIKILNTLIIIFLHFAATFVSSCFSSLSLRLLIIDLMVSSPTPTSPISADTCKVVQVVHYNKILKIKLKVCFEKVLLSLLGHKSLLWDGQTNRVISSAVLTWANSLTVVRADPDSTFFWKLSASSMAARAAEKSPCLAIKSAILFIQLTHMSYKSYFLQIMRWVINQLSSLLKNDCLN